MLPNNKDGSFVMTKPRHPHQVSTSITTKQANELSQIKKATGKRDSTIVREAIELYLDQMYGRKTNEVGLADDKRAVEAGGNYALWEPQLQVFDRPELQIDAEGKEHSLPECKNPYDIFTHQLLNCYGSRADSVTKEYEILLKFYAAAHS